MKPLLTHKNNLLRPGQTSAVDLLAGGYGQQGTFLEPRTYPSPPTPSHETLTSSKGSDFCTPPQFPYTHLNAHIQVLLLF
jgi:hypothetical protein